MPITMVVAETETPIEIPVRVAIAIPVATVMEKVVTTKTARSPGIRVSLQVHQDDPVTGMFARLPEAVSSSEEE